MILISSKSLKSDFRESPKFRETVLETILILNEKFIENSKSVILANLFKAHIEENISWAEFNHLSFILNGQHPLGYTFLKKMAKEKGWSRHARNLDGEPFMFTCGIGHRNSSLFQITNMGQKLYEYGIKPAVKTED